jgi:HEAT repeat protein
MIVGVWVALAVPAPVRAQDSSADPVEALRETLARNLLGPQMAMHRAKVLEEKVAALKTVGEMRQALALAEWKDNDYINPPLAAVDAKARGFLADNFRKQLTRAIEQGNEPTRLAVVQVLASLGNVRSLTPKDMHGLGRSMTPLMVQLCGDKSKAVRVAAAKALARMNPEPETAAATFKTLLQDKEIMVQRAAAAGLGMLVTESLKLQRRGRGNEGIEASSDDVLAAAKSAVEVAGPGSGDTDAEVRRLCLEALKAAAGALHTLLPDPFDQGMFPQPGIAMSDFQKRQLAEAQKALALEQKRFLPLVNALKAQSPAIHAGLQDTDEGVIREAAGVIEELAVANQRLRARVASVPLLANGELQPAAGPDHLGKDLRAAVPLLAKQLTHASVDVKLAVLYALETLDRDAAPAVDAVAKALDDTNPFVRWGAARALGRMAGFDGPEVVKAVTALGKHLADENENGRVRTTAAVALARYGPAARSAVNDLAAAVKKGDSDLRQLAMRALVAIGAEAKPALPALVEALTAKEAPVRLAAARTLGQLGPVAKEALRELRAAMDDADAAVSLAAADAILAITPAGK